MAKDKISRLAKKLNTPRKIQDYLDKIPFNFEKKGETYMSPASAVQAGRMHCFEGALFACYCLRKNGFKNYLLDLKVKNIKRDTDHILCAFRSGRHWGAISKTNHSVLRWRDPIYRNFRELAMSFFHEYFLDSGEKTLKSFSRPFDIWKRFGEAWVQKKEDLDEIAEALDNSPHLRFVPKKSERMIRKAGKTEVKGAAVTEW